MGAGAGLRRHQETSSGEQFQLLPPKGCRNYRLGPSSRDLLKFYDDYK